MYISVSTSMLEAVAQCSTLAALRTSGLEAKGEDKTRMFAGHAAHLAHEQWLLGANTDACIATFLGDYKDYSDRCLLSNDPYHHDNLVIVLRLFFDTHLLDQMPFLVTKPTVEQEMSALLLEGQVPVYLTTRPDGGLVSLRDNGSLWPFELKTTGHLTPQWMKEWSMHPQIMAHIFCWRAEGYNVKGVYMNAIEFRRPIQQTKDRCKDHGCAKRLCWQAHHQSQQFFVQPPASLYESWLREQRKNAEKYRRLVLSSMDSPAMEGLVNKTCGRCSFQDFCYSDRQAFDRVERRGDAPSWVTKSGLQVKESPR